MKEPEIKLFGQKIVFPENSGALVSGECSGQSTSRSGGGGGGGEEVREGGGEAHHEKQLHAQEDQEAEECETTMQEKDHNAGAEEPQNPSASLESDEDPKTPAADEEAVSESSNPKSGKPALKKPDKILPCPRCNSMDTKFCYYNNYNVNQPRHFCKSCQRYWTAGGTMRNVPVGAGRRKNKNPASHCRHISISEALHAAVARVDVPSGFHNPTLGPNGSILSFGPDSPLCESMASAMNLSDKRVQNGVRNGSGMKSETGVYCQKGDSRDDFSMRSSSMLEGCNNVPQQLVMPNINGAPYPIPCIPGVAWPVPWNPAMPLPAICPPGYPMPVYPAPYWNCGVPNPWNVPWVSTPPPAAANQKASGSGPNSPLGKHSRNGELLKPSNSPGLELSELKDPESSILVPKTLRIDDPHEAAKSSIWQTLGIKYDSVSREGLFKALQSKGDDKKHTISASPVMQANPAALSRSMTFQEGA